MSTPRWTGSPPVPRFTTTAPPPRTPLNDIDAQRHWLAGFGAAWVERQDALSLDDALLAALQDHAPLLRQLRAHGVAGNRGFTTNAGLDQSSLIRVPGDALAQNVGTMYRQRATQP